MKISFQVVWCPRMRSAEGGATRQRNVTSPPLRFLLPGSRVSKHPPPSEIMSHQTGIQGKSEIFLWFTHTGLFDESERAARNSHSAEMHLENKRRCESGASVGGDFTPSDTPWGWWLKSSRWLIASVFCNCQRCVSQSRARATPSARAARAPHASHNNPITPAYCNISHWPQSILHLMCIYLYISLSGCVVTNRERHHCLWMDIFHFIYIYFIIFYIYLLEMTKMHNTVP